jgi:hypothetical protein
LDTILDAIRRTENEPIQWLLIGSGQEEPKLRRFLAEHPSDKVKWLPWVDYAHLPVVISRASVALGIFGTSDKAGRVIPNKAYQILAAGKLLITRESPAMAALAEAYPSSIKTLPAGDGAALADAVRQSTGNFAASRPFPVKAAKSLGPVFGVQRLLRRLSR